MSISARSPNWLKIIILTSLSLVVLILGAMISLTTLVDPNRYQPSISNFIATQTGAKLKIGNLNWSFWPSFGLTAANLQLTSPNALESIPLLNIDTATLRLQLLPLISGKVAIDNLELAGVKLHLVTANAHNNWSLQVQPSVNNNNFLFELKQFTITNLSLSYRNLVTKQIFILPHFNFKLRPQHVLNFINPPFEYTTTTNQLQIKQAEIVINDLLKAKINLDYKNNAYQGQLTTEPIALNQLLTSCGLAKLSFLQAQPWQQVALSTQFNGSNNSLSISSGQLSLANTQVKFGFNFNSLQPLQAHNQIIIPDLEISQFMPLNGYHLRIQDLHLNGTLTANHQDLAQLQTQQQLVATKLTWDGYDLHRLSNQVAHILSSPIKIIDIDKTIRQIQASTAGIVAAGHKNLQLTSNLGHLNAMLNYHPNRLTLNQFNLNGPDLRASGSGSFNPSNLQFNGNVNAQFVADPTTLTAKVIYPVIIHGTNSQIDWKSVNHQIAANLGSSLTNTGKSIGHTTTSTMEKISTKLKSWF